MSERDGSVALERPRFPLRGGHVALDFANTVGWHASETPHEWLTDYPALVAWGWQAGVLCEDDARRLLDEVSRRPDAAAAALESAREAREVIYRIFTSIARGERAAAGDVAALDAAVQAAFDRLHLEWREGAPAWEWVLPADDFLAMVWPVVRAAAELLTSEERALVRQCGGDPCGWLFLDTSRKHNRRWCSMADCGNRAKARRHRRRRKVAGGV